MSKVLTRVGTKGGQRAHLLQRRDIRPCRVVRIERADSKVHCARRDLRAPRAEFGECRIGDDAVGRDTTRERREAPEVLD